MDEKNKRCVFCGETPGMFAKATVTCGPTYQLACKSCARELEGASEEELCRRALKLGLAEFPQFLEKRLKLITESEQARPACLQCGTKLRFGETQCLDNTPMRDSMFSDTFDVIPAYCPNCGKIEFYNPGYANQNPMISYLIKKDTGN